MAGAGAGAGADHWLFELTPGLFDAITNNNIDEIIDILNEGVSVDALDEDGYSALHTACYYGNDEIIKLLLERGANINVIAPNGEDVSKCVKRYFDSDIESDDDIEMDFDIADMAGTKKPEINNSRSCFDPIMQDEEDIIAYLNESKDNLVIVDESDTKAYCTTKTIYNTQMEDALMYGCKWASMSPTSVDTTNTYYNLNKLGIGSYLVHGYTKLESGKQLFKLFKTNTTVNNIVSKKLYKNMDSLVGTNHCADGTGGIIYGLLEFDL